MTEDSELALSFMDVIGVIQNAKRAGVCPMRVLLPRSRIKILKVEDDPVTERALRDTAVFGIPAGLADELVVLPEEYLAVWNEREV